MAITILKRSSVARVAFGLGVVGCSGLPESGTGGDRSATALPGTTTTSTTSTTPVGTSEAMTAPAQAELTVAVCDLLTIDEVEVAIGPLTPGPVYDDSAPRFFERSYDGADGNVMVDLTVSEERAPDSFEMGRDVNERGRIDGLGDEAAVPAPLTRLPSPSRGPVADTGVEGRVAIRHRRRLQSDIGLILGFRPARS